MERPITSESEPEKVISPFFDRQTEIVPPEKRKFRGWIWIVTAGFLLVVLGAIAATVSIRYINDPYRTLEEFPVGKYFDDYQSLAGSKYRVQLRVEADLGWKDNTGRLMLFSTADDPRPFAVMIPVGVANGITFTKGQGYLAEIQIKEGGLIYANLFQKN